MTGKTARLLTDRAIFTQRLKNITAGRQRARIDDDGLKPSAVLLPLCWKDDMPHIVLTRRSMAVEYHKGEISFPGGRAEDSDDGPTGTALREAWEEIGLSPDDVEVVGLLDDHLTIFGFHITPVIGLMPYPYDLRLNAESDSLIYIPASRFLSETAWMFNTAELNGHRVSIYYLECDEGVVWGATARILKHFADLLAGQELPFSDVSRSALDWVTNITAAQSAYSSSLKG